MVDLQCCSSITKVLNGIYNGEPFPIMSSIYFVQIHQKESSSPRQLAESAEDEMIR